MAIRHLHIVHLASCLLDAFHNMLADCRRRDACLPVLLSSLQNVPKVLREGKGSTSTPTKDSQTSKAIC